MKPQSYDRTAGFLIAASAGDAQHVKVIKEVRYPTAFEQTPVAATVNGRTVIVGSITTPTDFVTREVGASLDIHQAVLLAR